jgi:hypothetical protein
VGDSLGNLEVGNNVGELEITSIEGVEVNTSIVGAPLANTSLIGASVVGGMVDGIGDAVGTTLRGGTKLVVSTFGSADGCGVVTELFRSLLDGVVVVDGILVEHGGLSELIVVYQGCNRLVGDPVDL